MQFKSFILDPFQQRAIEAINQDKSVLVCAPTGAGKTLIAEYAIDLAIKQDKKIIYTAPIKALSNQKFRDFLIQYGPRVGIKTGDVTINPDAQIVLMTTEIFRNTLLENPKAFNEVEYVIFDEIHYIDDPDRGSVWEESIMFAPLHVNLIMLSATIPNYKRLAEWIRSIRPSPLEVIVSDERPVPLVQKLFVPPFGIKDMGELKHTEKEQDIRQIKYMALKIRQKEPKKWLIEHLFANNMLPAIFFVFSRRDCEKFAQEINQPLLNQDERKKLLQNYEELVKKFQIKDTYLINEIRKLLNRGVAYHHAGLLPSTKEIIERLFATGLIKLLFCTETFAVGINMPARTVVMTSIFKKSKGKIEFLKTREHHQMCGRAGRRGIDKTGYVYTMVNWPFTPARIIDKVINGQIEPVESRFNLSYSGILNLFARLGDKIFTACKNSFANFQYKDRKRTKYIIQQKLQLLKARLNVLQHFGYINKEKLLPKGNFASKINGYEIQITELYTQGYLYGLDEHELCAVFCAIVYDSRKGGRYRHIKNRKLRRLQRHAKNIINLIVDIEKTNGIRYEGYLTKRLNFKLNTACYLWSKGCNFIELKKYTDADHGDIVRCFRQTVQMLRQFLFALENQKKDPHLQNKIVKGLKNISRDEVDAHKQLCQSIPEAEILPYF